MGDPMIITLDHNVMRTQRCIGGCRQTQASNLPRGNGIGFDLHCHRCRQIHHSQCNGAAIAFLPPDHKLTVTRS